TPAPGTFAASVGSSPARKLAVSGAVLLLLLLTAVGLLLPEGLFPLRYGSNRFPESGNLQSDLHGRRGAGAHLARGAVPSLYFDKARAVQSLGPPDSNRKRRSNCSSWEDLDCRHRVHS